MTAQSDDSDHKSAADKMLEEAWINLQHARWQFHSEAAKGDMTTETRRELAVATLALWDTILSERDHTKIKNDIPESHIPDLREMVHTTTTVRQDTPGRGRGGGVKQVPAITQASFELLATVSREVMDLASELGKGLSVQSARPIYHAGKRDPEDYPEPVKDDIPKPQ